MIAGISGALLFGAISPSVALAKLNVVATTEDFWFDCRGHRWRPGLSHDAGQTNRRSAFRRCNPVLFLRLNRADAVVEGGAELEIGWLPAPAGSSAELETAAGAPDTLRAARASSCWKCLPPWIAPKAISMPPAIRIILLTPTTREIVAQNIASGFSALDPKSAGLFQSNLKKFTSQLDAKNCRMGQAVGTISRPAGGRLS